MRSILIIKLSALGDVVQAEGAIHDIRRHHSKDRITVMTTPAYKRLLERCPWVDDVFIDPRASRYNIGEMLKLRSRLHQRSFDRVYDLQQVSRTRFYKKWLFPRVEWCGDARDGYVYLKQDESKTCAPERFVRLLTLTGIDARHTLKSDLSWMAEPVEEILTENGLEPGYVVLIPGASARHEQKRWPCFQELADRLQAEGRQVVTVPGPDEMDLCRSIPGTMLAPEGGFYNFFVLAGVIKQAAYAVGNDTGPTHIAANLGCPGLALYGGHARPETTGIQYTGFSWLAADNLAELSVDRVWEHVRQHLGRN